MIDQIGKVLNYPLKRILLCPAVILAGAAYYSELSWYWTLLVGLGIVFLPSLFLELHLSSLLVRRSRKSKQHMDRAEIHLENGEHDLAITEYSRAIEIHRVDSWPVRDFLAVPRLFERITEVTNLEPWLLRDRAWCYERQGLPHLAISDLSAFIDMDRRVRTHGYYDEANMESELLRVLNRRARLYLEVGEHELAIADYVGCLNSDPGMRGVPLFTRDFRFELFGTHSSWLDYCEVLCHLGQAFNASEDYDAAVNVFSWAIHFGKEHIYLRESYEGRAKAYEATGRFELAMEDFRSAHRILWEDEPDIAENEGIVYGERARDYWDEGKYDLAIVAYTSAIEIDPEEAANYNSRGLVYLEKGDYKLAIEDFEEAINLDPEIWIAYDNRDKAYSLMEISDPKEN